MLPDIENLLKLQVIDKEIRRLHDEVAELPKRVAVIELRLAGTKAQLEKAQAAVKTDEASRRKFETNINDLRGKISKYRDQSLDVKTNEQYKALLHEIQFAEKEIGTNEDKILELMVNADARDKEVKAAQADLKAETAEIEQEKEQARQRTAEDEKLLAEARAKRDQLRGGYGSKFTPPCTSRGKIRKQVHDFLTTLFYQPVEIHLDPWWNSTDQGHVFFNRFFYNFIEFCFPFFNAIGFIGGELIRAEIMGDAVIGDATKPARWYSAHSFQFRRAGKKNHFTIPNTGIACLGHIHHHGIARGIEMVVDGSLLMGMYLTPLVVPDVFAR